MGHAEAAAGVITSAMLSDHAIASTMQVYTIRMYSVYMPPLFAAFLDDPRGPCFCGYCFSNRGRKINH